MKISAIYPTFMGEQSWWGIGEPVIFLRLQGCHLRCYKKTLGVLCDTPEGLDRNGGEEVTLQELMKRLNEMRFETGISKICLTGGDPLWRSPIELTELFQALSFNHFTTMVETSGTLSMQEYRGFHHVHWVLDYKTPSAGIPYSQANVILKDLLCLDVHDTIKFVLHDEVDYEFFKQRLHQIKERNFTPRIAVGVFWNGPLTTFKLVEYLLRDKLLSWVQVNMQTHKAVLRETDTVDPRLT